MNYILIAVLATTMLSSNDYSQGRNFESSANTTASSYQTIRLEFPSEIDCIYALNTMRRDIESRGASKIVTAQCVKR